MQTLYRPLLGNHAITEERHLFPLARDAIDAVSAFEASTFTDWEYRIEAWNDAGDYIVAVRSLEKLNGRWVRGYLTPCEAIDVAEQWPHTGPFDKPMREDYAGWYWRAYDGKELGPFRTRSTCEENISIHCGD